MEEGQVYKWVGGLELKHTSECETFWGEPELLAAVRTIYYANIHSLRETCLTRSMQVCRLECDSVSDNIMIQPCSVHMPDTVG